MIKLNLGFVLLSSLTAVRAGPAPHVVEDRVIRCNIVDVVFLALKNLGVPGTSFCRSYLHVPGTSTVPTTTYPPPVTVHTATVTNSVTSPTCPSPAKRTVAGFNRPDEEMTGRAEAKVVDKRVNIPAALSAFAAARLSSACSCLSIKPTATVTTTVAGAASTVSAVATTTTCVDYCSITYNGGGVTPGNTVQQPPGNLDGPACCALCWQTTNCVASAVGLGFCQLLVKTSVLVGAPTSNQCPLGIEDYTYAAGPGTLYRGPCSPLLS